MTTSNSLKPGLALLGVALIGVASIGASWYLLGRPLLTLQLSVWAGVAACGWGAVMLAARTRKRLTCQPRPRWRGADALRLVVNLGSVVILVLVAVYAAVSHQRVLDLLPFVLAFLLGANALRVLLRAKPSYGRGTQMAYVLAGGGAAVLVWMWPDVGLLLFAWSCAVALALVGVRLLWQVLRAKKPSWREVRVRFSRRGHAVGASLAVLAVVMFSIGSAWLLWDVKQVDDFYAWEDAIPTTPGALLRVGKYEGNVPPGAEGLRILYSTTRADGSAALASAVVAVPTAPSAEDRPVLSWQHATTGVVPACAPSLTEDALMDSAVPGAAAMIGRGWVIVATDYPGQGTSGPFPYLIGEGEGRAALDSVRAVQQVEAAQASSRAMFWGHSQGGHATLWAGQIAAEYAPELDVIGVAALAAANDPLAMAQWVLSRGPSPLGQVIAAYVVTPYSDEYPDISVEDFIHPAGRAFIKSASTRCVYERDMPVTVVVAKLRGDKDGLYRLNLDKGAVRDRLSENIALNNIALNNIALDESGSANGELGGDFAPLFLGQGDEDEVVPIEHQRKLQQRVCAANMSAITHEYPGRNHLGVVAEDSPMVPDLLDWTDAVIAGERPSNCED